MRLRKAAARARLFHVGGGAVREAQLLFNKSSNNSLLPWGLCQTLAKPRLKDIQTRQDFPFTSADVLSGKALAGEPASFPPVPSKAAYVPGNKLCEEKSKNPAKVNVYIYHESEVSH